MVNQLPLMAIMAIAAVLGATGQMFLKKASSAFGLSIAGTIANPWLYGFVASYGSAVVIQLLVYKAGGKVAVVYPVVSLSYIVAAIMAWKLFGEAFSGWSLAGILTIIAGVAMIGYGAGGAGV